MKYIKITSLIFLFSISCWVKAAEFCVSNSTELSMAFSDAKDNNEHDVIKIMQGSYETSGTNFSYQGESGKDLEISGGWRDLSNTPCGLKINDPYLTNLDGGFASTILQIRLSENTNFTVSNITFINALDNASSGGGLAVNKSDSINASTVTIENNAFINNTARQGSALRVLGVDEVYVRNNLFTANVADYKYVVEIEQIDAYGIYFTNNTVMYNDAVDAGSRGGVRLYVSGTSKMLVANNIMLENDIGDFFFFAGGGQGDQVYFKNNNVGVVGGGGSIFEDSGNFNLPPRFEPGILNFTPSATSPLVNAGVKPCSLCPIPIPFDETWSLGGLDLIGGTRVQNTRVDVGAVESGHVPDLIFWDRF